MESPSLADFSKAPWVRGSEPGLLSERSLPLERYFPPVEEGMVRNWVERYASPGSYILDPFGQNPFTALELARAGYRILVSANNPIAAFTLTVLAGAPSAEVISQALLQLNQNKMRDGSTLEEYLSNFYRLDCPNPQCGAESKFEVETFIWSEEGTNPHLAIGSCQDCGFTGEIELTPSMQESLGRTPSYALTRSQVLEKVAGQDPPLRRVMEDVVSYYSPRALVALQILLSKIETSNLTQQQSDVLKAMWLTAADQANQLWIWPKGKNRPKQLLRPPLFQEVNVWKAFLRSASLWTQFEEEVKLREWPKRVPPTGGISLFEGRLRELDEVPEPGLIKLVQTSLPRRNQAWWNLSGLWSGWLWGKEGVKTLRNSLLKQRYDWTWHSVALKKVLAQLPGLIGQDVPILLLTSELDTLFLFAGMLGAKNAGLQLHSAAIDGENEVLQCVWRLPTLQPSISSRKLQVTIKNSGRSVLNQLGEPTHWLRLLTFTVAEQLIQGNLDERPKPNEMLNDLESEFAAALNDPAVFQRFSPGTTPEAGLYWLTNPIADGSSMADLAEQVVISELQKRSVLTFDELYAALYARLSGMMTPPDELVQAIIESYAETEKADTTTIYRIQPRETAEARTEDLKQIKSLLEQMADTLDYRRESRPERILWVDQTGSPIYSFFPIANAQISRILSMNQDLPGQKFIVLPGSRSNLIAYKLKRDPNLRLLKGDKWQLIKFRQLRNLAGNPLLNRELFNSQINGDPPEYHTAQLALF